MGALLELIQRKPQALWLDSHAYCAQLLAAGKAPWMYPSEFVAWQRKAQGLLKPDVASLPVAPAIEAWLQDHLGLRAAMAAKTRATYPLRTLLSDEALRAHLVELAQGLRAGVGAMPLALVIPSPRAWVLLAYRQAHAEGTEVGEDEADSASVYIADFLRAFGESGVDILLMQEDGDYAPTSAQDFTCYQSVLNVAAHYRWDAGLQLAAPCALPEGCGFAIAPQAVAGTPTGIALDASFWNGAAIPQPAAFRYARIPSDAQPESVLQRLAGLR